MQRGFRFVDLVLTPQITIKNILFWNLQSTDHEQFNKLRKTMLQRPTNTNLIQKFFFTKMRYGRPMCRVAWPGYSHAVQSGQIFFLTKIYSYAPCSAEGGLVGAVAGDVR